MRTAEVVPLARAWALDRSFTYSVPDELDVAVGSLVRVPLGGRKVRGIVVSLAPQDSPHRDLEEIQGLVVGPPLAPHPMPSLLEEISVRYATPRGVVHDRVVPPRVRVRHEPVTSRSGGSGGFEGYEGMDRLRAALADHSGGTWLLEASPRHDRGDLIASLVAQTEGQALVCVPEVRWGSPVMDSLTKSYPDLARLDSAAGDMTRSEGWLALAAGHHLGVGGRAAVLAPAQDLGIIVVEDEANIAFKEDRSPRFDARWVASRRAELAGAVCVFVTSAPSLNAVAWATEERWVRPLEAERKAARPNVELAEPSPDGISSELRRAIGKTLAAGSTVGLLVPNRGYATSLWCRDCHRSVRCPRCEAGVVHDRERSSARCPRCSFTGRAPDKCPSCGSAGLLSVGAGSERYEEQLALMFPRARVRRVDPNVLEGLESAPALGDADIYVTTWIGTKAAIRPPVSLVGVLDADTLIRRPHMGAAEDAYLALSELSRWAGPADHGGRLLIQTREPGHPAIQSVSRADPRYFLSREEPVREELGYPPFSETIRVQARGDRWSQVMDEAIEAAERAGARALGPVPVLTRDGVEVQEALLKCTDALEVARRLRVILPGVPRGTTLRLDVDPR